MAKRNNPQSVAGKTSKEMRSEYSRLRSIANKRIARLEAAGFRAPARYPKISALQSGALIGGSAGLSLALLDVESFLKSSKSTVKGARRYQAGREKAARTLGQQMGINLTGKDVRKIGAFMDALRNKYGALQVTSDVAMDVFKFGQKNKIPMNVLRAHYQEFKDNLTEFEALSRKYQTQYKSGGGGEAYLARLHKMMDKERL